MTMTRGALALTVRACVAFALMALDAGAAGFRLIPLGPMIVPRHSHGATLLPDGRVLITGGSRANGHIPTASTEIFDPRTRMFTPGPSLNVARLQHAALLLPDGRVLVAGGFTLTYVVPTAMAEIIDPGGASTRIGDMAVPRGGEPFLALGRDGAAWIFGGQVEGRFGEVTDVVERLSPGSTRWEPAGRALLPCNGTWVPLGPDSLLRLAGGTHRSANDALRGACEQWGEEWTLGERARSQLVRMPKAIRPAGARAAVPGGSRLLLMRQDGVWFAERDDEWRLAGCFRAMTESLASLMVFSAWTDDEAIMLFDDLEVVDAASAAVLHRAPLVPGGARTITVISRDAVLICGGTAQDGRLGEHALLDAFLLVRDPPGPPQTSSPAAPASTPRP